ncbi:hypothetical protein BC829DRAFT_49183 [Chytridium lagenaria]|nr:hypothetical protein BC829DRAFT_49183 [Chytridium lagenaria]
MPKLSTAAIPLVQYPTIPLHPSHLRAPGRARYSFESDRIESVIESSIGEALSFVGHSRDFSDVPVDFLRFHRRASENTSLDDTATRRSSSHKSTTTTLVGTSDRALPKLPSRSSRTTTSSQIQEEADEDETVSELYENSCEAETLARDRTLLTRRTVGHGDVDGLQSRGGISSRCDDDYVGMIKMRDLDDFDGDSCVSSIQQDGGRRDGAEAGDWWTLPRN